MASASIPSRASLGTWAALDARARAGDWGLARSRHLSRAGHPNRGQSSVGDPASRHRQCPPRSAQRRPRRAMWRLPPGSGDRPGLGTGSFRHPADVRPGAPARVQPSASCVVNRSRREGRRHLRVGRLGVAVDQPQRGLRHERAQNGFQASNSCARLDSDSVPLSTTATRPRAVNVVTLVYIAVFSTDTSV